MKAIKWGLVTFVLGITTGVLGSYLPTEHAAIDIIFVSAAYSVLGAFAISEFWES